jgi:hypothetical protein
VIASDTTTVLLGVMARQWRRRSVYGERLKGDGMPKFIVLIAAVGVLSGAGVALAGQGATNQQGEFIALNVAVSPPVAGTANAPRGVGVSLDSFTGNRINGNSPITNDSIVVRFNKGFKWNGPRFPGCEINATDPTVCPKSTQVGTGTAEASFPGANGAPPTFLPARVVAYNGKPYQTEAPTLIFIAFVNGQPAAELDFRVQNQPTGPYGLAFVDIDFPSAPPAPFGLTKFSVSIRDQIVTRSVRGKKVKFHLVEAPTTCRGSWKFAQTNTSTNASPLTATDSQPCTRQRR